MSRKMLLALSAAVTLLIFYSIGNEYCIYAPAPHRLSEFLRVYLNAPQKYFYNGMIYGLPAIYAFSIPFASPEIRTRMQKSTFWCIFPRCLITALGLCLFVMLMSLGSAVYSGMQLDFCFSMLSIGIRLAAFYLQCDLMFYCAYTLRRNPVIAIAVVMGVNLLLNVALLAYNFTVTPLNADPLPAFDITIALSTAAAVAFLYCGLRRKEWLS